MLRRFIVTCVVLAALAAPAAAQREPDFATLDRGDGISHFGLDLAWVKLDPPPLDSVLHLELFGQFVAQSGLGFYAAFPIAKSFGDGPAEMELDGEASIGDLEVGGLYVISAPELSWVFRLGLVVPTASEDGGDYVTNFYGQQFRLTDIALVDPNDFFARLAVSPLYHAHSVFLRIDVGVDVPFAEDDEDAYQADPIGRLNLGAGVDLGQIALMAELATIVEFDNDDVDPDNDRDVFTTAAFTARFMGPQLQPYLTLGIPVQEYIRDTVRFFVGGGIQGVLH
jgi:hypothetical protein